MLKGDRRGHHGDELIQSETALEGQQYRGVIDNLPRDPHRSRLSQIMEQKTSLSFLVPVPYFSFIFLMSCVGCIRGLISESLNIRIVSDAS